MGRHALKPAAVPLLTTVGLAVLLLTVVFLCGAEQQQQQEEQAHRRRQAQVRRSPREEIVGDDGDGASPAIHVRMPPPAPGPERFLLPVYLYSSWFNDKRTRWTYTQLVTATTLKRTLVLPKYNVFRERNRFDEVFEPYEVFFDVPSMQELLPAVTHRDYVDRFGQEADVALVSPGVAASVLHLGCTPRQFVEASNKRGDDNAATQAFELDVFGSTFSVPRLLCWDGLMDDALGELLEPYARVVVYGFDSHNNHGLMLMPGTLAAFHARDQLKAGVVFAAHVKQAAQQFVQGRQLKKCAGLFAAVHWRSIRHSSALSPDEFVGRVTAWLRSLQQRTGADSPSPCKLVLLTDQPNPDVISDVARRLPIPVVQYTPPLDEPLLAKPGVVAVTEQEIAVRAAYFLGLRVSTFTEVIADLRKREYNKASDFLEDYTAEPTDSRSEL